MPPSLWQGSGHPPVQACKKPSEPRSRSVGIHYARHTSLRLAHGGFPMRLVSPVAFILLTCVPQPAIAQRLPRSVIPEHYDLAITPNLAEATFAAEETIGVTIHDATTGITL